MRVLRAVQPMMRLGLGVVGSLSSGRARHALQHETQLARPSRGAFVWGVRQPSVSRPVKSAGLSANLRGVARNLSDGRSWLASPPLPLPKKAPP